MKTKIDWIIQIFLLLTFSTVLIAGDDPDASDLANTLNDASLLAELRQGGYTLYFRHGKTDHDSFDSDRKNLENCETQRLLSEEGRQEMKWIGEIIRQLDIKIGTVTSSPYCRSIDTATLAFGRTEIDPDLKHTVTADEAMVNRQAAALKKMLSTIPAAAGTNDVISGHTANLQEATGIWPKPEGVAIVFKPEAGSFKYIATIRPTDWQRLIDVAGQ